MRIATLVWVPISFVLLLTLSACQQQTEGTQEESHSSTPQAQVNGNARRGAELIRNYGCGACHTIEGIPGADTQVGPPLSDFAGRRYIAGTLINTPENVIAWIQNPQAIEPNTSMPNMDIPSVDARDIAAYLYSLN